MINIFSYNIDKYSVDEVRNMCQAIEKVLPDEDTLIAIPKYCDFYHDVPIETLYYYRQMLDDIIQERQRSNAEKNVL